MKQLEEVRKRLEKESFERIRVHVSQSESETIYLDEKCVSLAKVLKLLDGYVCIPKKQLQDKLENAERQMKSWQHGSEEWFKVAYQHGYFVIKEFLDMLKEMKET